MANQIDPEKIVSYVENLIVGICCFQIKEGHLKPIYVNDGCCRMLGYSKQELGRAMEDVERNIIPADLPVFRQGIADILKDDGAVEFSFRTVTLSGNVRWLNLNGNLYSRKKEEASMVCVLTDITEKKAMEEQMAEQAERLKLIVESTREILLDYNAKTDVMVIRQIMRGGIPNEEIIPDFFKKMDVTPYHPDDRNALLKLYNKLLRKPGFGELEYRHKRFCDNFRWYQLVLSSIADVDGYVTRIVGRMLDIQERKERELELDKRARKDSLSGLYNKGAVREIVEEVLEETRQGTIHAMLILDLDNFKNVNDTRGHAAGDRLIELVSQRLKDIFKGYDIIGRIGGDEFLVFMRNIRSSSNADTLGMQLLEAMQYPYDLPGGEPMTVLCSVGISIYPFHGTEYAELFEKADMAMYHIKGRGKNSYQIYKNYCKQE